MDLIAYHWMSLNSSEEPEKLPDESELDDTDDDPVPDEEPDGQPDPGLAEQRARVSG
jgi:hypothetical protein